MCITAFGKIYLGFSYFKYVLSGILYKQKAPHWRLRFCTQTRHSYSIIKLIYNYESIIWSLPNWNERNSMNLKHIFRLMCNVISWQSKLIKYVIKHKNTNLVFTNNVAKWLINQIQSFGTYKCFHSKRFPKILWYNIPLNRYPVMLHNIS